jgi:hypothetical protein
MRYLSGTRDFKLTYRKTDSAIPIGYTDSDWVGDKTDRKSTSGLAVTMGGTVVSWKSSKQHITAQSSGEAEYPTLLHTDSQCAAAIATTHVVNQRSKHIDIRYHVLREYVSNGVFQLIDTNTQDNLADLFTKALPATTFKYMVTSLQDAPVLAERLSTRHAPVACLAIATAIRHSMLCRLRGGRRADGAPVDAKGVLRLMKTNQKMNLLVLIVDSDSVGAWTGLQTLKTIWRWTIVVAPPTTANAGAVLQCLLHDAAQTHC